MTRAAIDDATTPTPDLWRRQLVERLRVTRVAAVRTITALVAGLLLIAWLITAAASLLSVFAPLLLPITALVRATCDAQRRWTGRTTGVPVSAGYRRLRGNVVRQACIVLKDPASWRDAAWLLWFSVIGWAMAALTVSLFLGSIFYLSYPLLYAVTPPPVFRDPFGPWSHLHSVAQACTVMPAAALCVVLWYTTTLPLARVDAAVARTCLGND